MHSSWKMRILQIWLQMMNISRSTTKSKDYDFNNMSVVVSTSQAEKPVILGHRIHNSSRTRSMIVYFNIPIAGLSFFSLIRNVLSSHIQWQIAEIYIDCWHSRSWKCEREAYECLPSSCSLLFECYLLVGVSFHIRIFSPVFFLPIILNSYYCTYPCYFIIISIRNCF